MKPKVVLHLAILAGWVLTGPAVRGQTPDLAVPGETQAPKSTSELKQMSLDDLTNYRVISVSKQEEQLSQAASAIQLITSEDIRRSGATSLPEALRLASNLEVAQVDSRQWAITARGFNGTTANKLLVLLDGRSIYTPLFSGVFWDVQDTLLDDVDRIEVISGPGGTLWGANAVNGVINVITKSARDTQGLLVSGGGGSTLRGFGGVRYGGRIAEGAHYRAYVKHFDRDASRLHNGDDAGDDWFMTQGGFRADWETPGDNLLTFQGDAYGGSISQVAPGEVTVSGANAIGRWTKTFSEDSGLKFQVYYDHTHRSIPRTFHEDLDTVDVEFQHGLALGGWHRLLWGGNYRFNDDRVRNSDVLAFRPSHLTTHLYSGFVQDEIDLVEDRVRLTLGSKFEHNDYSGFEYQPAARLGWRPADRHFAWTAVSRAVRTPSRIDRDFFVGPPINLAGGPGFDSEKLLAYEVGYRVRPWNPVSLSVAGFYHDYDDLRSLENSTPRVLANGLEGEGYGVEMTGAYQVTPWWRLHAGYTYLQMQLHTKDSSSDLSGETQEGDSPHHHLHIRSLMNITDQIEWDAMIRYVDRLTNQDVPSYWSLDLRLAYRPIERLEIAVVGQNLLDSQHPEFGTGAGRREIQRSVYGRITWSF